MHAYTYKVVSFGRVVDGDTVDLTCDLGFRIHTVNRFRFLNYNAPETRGPERAHGRIAKEALASMAAEDQRRCAVEVHKGDAFGRWLCELVMPTGERLTDLLVARGLGVRWDGRGARPAFDPAATYPAPTQNCVSG